MINQEELLLQYLADIIKNKKNITVLQLKLSLIKKELKKEKTIFSLLSMINGILETNGRSFCLKNDDIFVFYSKNVKENTIKAGLIKIWLQFSADKQTEKANELLEERFLLPSDSEKLSHLISRISNETSVIPKKEKFHNFFEETEKTPIKSSFIYNEKPQNLFTPEMLTRVIKALQKTDFTNMIRRQSICIILEDSEPQHLYEEVFVSIIDLSDSLLPGVSLVKTPWLFQDLTETLDKRVLHNVSMHDDGAFTKNFSINLNVSTILSEDFKNFDENVRSSDKHTVMLELQPIDIFSDLNSYLMARDFAQNLGYKICIDGVSAKTLKFINRERLGADYIKITWQDNLPELVEQDDSLKDILENIGLNKAILCRVDNRQALDFAKDFNISLFQGRYIQDIFSTSLRNRRMNAAIRRY